MVRNLTLSGFFLPYKPFLPDCRLTRNSFGGSIKIVHDGSEALEFLFGARAHRPHQAVPRLIVLDLKLPGVDGLEVLRRIKSDSRTRAIPVVMFTASHEDRDIIESYQLGVNSYIVKPVDAEQFTTVVQQLGLYWLLLNQPPSP